MLVRVTAAFDDEILCMPLRYDHDLALPSALTHESCAYLQKRAHRRPSTPLFTCILRRPSLGVYRVRLQTHRRSILKFSPPIRGRRALSTALSLESCSTAAMLTQANTHLPASHVLPAAAVSL